MALHLYRFIDIGEFSPQSAWCCYMTTYYDIPADLLIPALAEKLSSVKDIEQQIGLIM